MMNTPTRFLAAVGAAAALAAVSLVSAAAPPAPYFNGFEDVNDTMPPAATADHAMSGVVRVPSGTNGVTSADGAWHAEAPTGGPFMRYGGYSAVFPEGGYTTSIDIYLDTAESQIGEDSRFDWSSAVNNPAGSHRRDFVFNVGTDGAGGFVMSASNNAGRANSFPANPARNPITIDTAGWYTFMHSFEDNGAGVLEVVMTVSDADGNVLGTWTLSDPSDVIGTTVGGNRYGWLVNNEFPGLALDNIARSGELPQPETKDDCKKDGWQDLHRADGSTFKNQGDCIQYVNTGK
jgi:hypothetical protein